MISLILKREVKAFFSSPQSHLLTGIFMLVSGWIFFNLLTYFATHIQPLPAHLRHTHDFSNVVWIKFFGNLNFLVMVFTPLVGMSSISQEYKQGTIDLYFSSSVNDWEFIMAKFLSISFQMAFFISLTVVFPLLMSNLDFADTSFIYTAYMGLMLNILCYSSISLLASAISPSTILAGVISIVVIFFCWMISAVGDMTSNYLILKIINNLSVSYHFQNFIKGWISLSDILFYGSFTFSFLFLSKKRIEGRKW